MANPITVIEVVPASPSIVYSPEQLLLKLNLITLKLNEAIHRLNEVDRRVNDLEELP
jgi:hypothetical protein